jgi:uncharacterized membrane protein YeaQ/YmgE (transglycosylase-associated protein family)
MFWLIWVIIVGLIAGWATGKIMKGSGMERSWISCLALSVASSVAGS